MPLENLLTLIEKLQERIDSHGDALRQSEALTRYALIDPLLRELGWDTEDPDMVIVEYSSGGGRVDYALRNDGKPVIMLEAKKLDRSLNDAIGQGIQYCLVEGTEYFSVTDGRRWEIYETHKPVPIDKKRIVSFDLKDLSAADACLKALALWRPSVISGEITVGEIPVIGLPDNRTDTTEPQPTEETTVQPTSPFQSEEGWVTLSELKRQEGSKPIGILFSDDSQISINSWRNLQIEIVRWLINEGILNTDHCPIKGPGLRAKRYVISINPTHSDGKEFTNEEKIENFYIETNYSSKSIAENVKHIINEVNQDPAQFHVRFP